MARPEPQQASPLPAAGADDLLAQMAGDEIDRLLAEADVEAALAPKPNPSHVSSKLITGDETSSSGDVSKQECDAANSKSGFGEAGDAIDSNVLAASVDELLKETAALAAQAKLKSSSEVQINPPPAFADNPSDQGMLLQPGDAIVNSINVEPVHDTVELTSKGVPGVSLEAIEASIPSQASNTSLSKAHDIEASASSLDEPFSELANSPTLFGVPETSHNAAEIRVTQDGAATPRVLEKEPSSAITTLEIDPVLPPPASVAIPKEEQPNAIVSPISLAELAEIEQYAPSFLVRILEFINSPLDFLPETVRDAMGKIGLITLVNAIAVIIYVFVFRRK